MTSVQPKSLADYFHHSGQFYFILTDPEGRYIYVNPLFQKRFVHIAANFTGHITADTFVTGDIYKYHAVAKQCLRHPGDIVHKELQVKSKDGSLCRIRWEFSACNMEDAVPSIQAIGIPVDGSKRNGLLNKIWRTQKDTGIGEIFLPQLIDQEIERQKQFTQATIDLQEKERQDIGKELHDNINQHLSTARLYLEIARDKTSGETFMMIDFAHERISGIINQIRQLSQSLVPPSLTDLGLVESVQELCDSLSERFDIAFHHQHFNEEETPRNLKLMFFRIVQEQINHISRQANADHIEIRLQTDAEYIALTMIDNGKDFNSANYKSGPGFTNMISRADLFKGKVEIEAQPGKGCMLSVTVPRIRQ